MQCKFLEEFLSLFAKGWSDYTNMFDISEYYS